MLVGQDGVQHAPIHFPKGGHLLAFLTCLENGLLPRSQLDPPLWSQRGKGKVLPKLRRKTSAMKGGSLGSMEKDGTQIFEGEEATDYVFRIINTFKPDMCMYYVFVIFVQCQQIKHCCQIYSLS